MSIGATHSDNSTAPVNVALGARGLEKRFGRKIALAGIDVSIPVGSVTGLVGPNGAGKSTLIRTWAGFERPDRGSVEVMGVDPSVDGRRIRDLVGYVPQNPRIYEDLTVTDHLDLAAQLRASFDREGAAAHLERVGVAPGARGRHLSGGQQAQVALALALGTGAAVLLLDEPLAALDPLARREFLEQARVTSGERTRTVLLSSHVVGDVAQACDRVAVLGAGAVLAHDTLENLTLRHSVTDAPAPLATLVGSFPAEHGHTNFVYRTDGGVPVGRQATLEEVVLAYLAAGRHMEASRR